MQPQFQCGFGDRATQATATRADGAPDTVVTGAVVVDHWGVVKADVGVRDGRATGPEVQVVQGDSTAAVEAPGGGAV